MRRSFKASLGVQRAGGSPRTRRGARLKRRLRTAGLPGNLRPHSFRVLVVTDLLEQGVPLEDVRTLVGHSQPQTTALYDRRERRVARSVVEWISICSPLVVLLRRSLGGDAPDGGRVRLTLPGGTIQTRATPGEAGGTQVSLPGQAVSGLVTGGYPGRVRET